MYWKQLLPTGLLLGVAWVPPVALMVASVAHRPELRGAALAWCILIGAPVTVLAVVVLLGCVLYWFVRG